MNVPELQELSEEQCWRMLAKKKVGRLAVSIESRPDIFPVNYQVDGEVIVLRTAPGLKLAAATLGEGVAFEVDALDELNHSGWSVVVHGTASEVVGVEELIHADRLLIEPWSRGSTVKNRYIRIEPSDLTGRRIPGAGTNPTTVAPGPDW